MLKNLVATSKKLIGRITGNPKDQVKLSWMATANHWLTYVSKLMAIAVLLILLEASWVIYSFSLLGTMLDITAKAIDLNLDNNKIYIELAVKTFKIIPVVISNIDFKLYLRNISILPLVSYNYPGAITLKSNMTQVWIESLTVHDELLYNKTLSVVNSVSSKNSYTDAIAGIYLQLYIHGPFLLTIPIRIMLDIPLSILMENLLAGESTKPSPRIITFTNIEQIAKLLAVKAGKTILMR